MGKQIANVFVNCCTSCAIVLGLLTLPAPSLLARSQSQQQYTAPPPPPPPSASETARPESAAAAPAPAELDRIVGRMALYPDPLLAHVLTASTYWDEVADAARWADEHSYLKGDALANAINEDTWRGARTFSPCCHSPRCSI
jgi:hypothetical protein